MKKTAATMLLLAGLGGCVSPNGGKPATKPFGAASRGVEVPGVVGPMGTPVMMTAEADKAAKAKKDSGVVQAKGTGKKDSGIVQAQATMPAGPVDSTAGYSRVIGNSGAVESSNGSVHLAGGFGGNCSTCQGGGYGGGFGGGPMMGPAGAVAAYGAWGPGMGGAMFPNQRTSVKFVSPQGMKVTWLGPTGFIEPGITAQASYNFAQGNVYRLRLSGIPTRPGKTYYPTLELTHSTTKTVEFLSHNTVPVGFTDEDLAQVATGNLVTKVIYLPDPQFADLAVGGAEELVSTKLEPGADPVVEANRRGTILAVIRIGNIDLENPYSPAMDTPPANAMPPVMAPGAPGMMPGMPRPVTPAPTPKTTTTTVPPTTKK